MIATLIITITALALLEVRTPKQSSAVMTSTIRAATRLWWVAKIHVPGCACQGAEVNTTWKYCDQPEATVAAPNASSSIRSQPMIHASSSPRLA